MSRQDIDGGLSINIEDLGTVRNGECVSVTDALFAIADALESCARSLEGLVSPEMGRALEGLSDLGSISSIGSHLGDIARAIDENH